MADFAGRYLVGFDAFNGLVGAFSLFALLLATLGTYGVTAYAVGQRVHEIGVRLAVGASPRAILRMIAWSGLVMSLSGILLGALMLWPMLRLIGTALDGLSLPPVEPGTVVATAAILFLVTLLAAGVPAVRASMVEPLKVLKMD
jgi:ABC-type antimicrobial peptide transport system permease subunit